MSTSKTPFLAVRSSDAGRWLLKALPLVIVGLAGLLILLMVTPLFDIPLITWLAKKTILLPLDQLGLSEAANRAIMSVVIVAVVAIYHFNRPKPSRWNPIAPIVTKMAYFYLATNTVSAVVWTANAVKQQFNHERFDIHGNALDGYVITPDGEVKYYPLRRKTDPTFGIPLQPVTREVMPGLESYERGEFARVQPSASSWMTRGGSANLWYTRDENGGLVFWNGAGFDLYLMKELKPVTAEIRAEWEKEHREELAAESKRRDEAEVRQQALAETARQKMEAEKARAEVEVLRLRKEDEVESLRRRIALAEAREKALAESERETMRVAESRPEARSPARQYSTAAKASLSQPQPATERDLLIRQAEESLRRARKR